eukprot:13981-Heterococcus_DN1.PRE.2
MLQAACKQARAAAVVSESRETQAYCMNSCSDKQVFSAKCQLELLRAAQELLLEASTSHNAQQLKRYKVLCNTEVHDVVIIVLLATCCPLNMVSFRTQLCSVNAR